MNRSEYAIRMIEREIERIAVSQFPNDEFCTGLIQMAYGQADITDEQERELTRRAAFITRKRRDDLREQHIQDVIRRSAA
ncbi:hypothetical protein D3C81_2208130 [compost metagenome]